MAAILASRRSGHHRERRNCVRTTHGSVVALEGAPHGVTSNCVSPGYVRTPLVERQIASQAEQHGLAEGEVVERVMLARPAIKRLVEPAEVAECVAYLCGGAASFVTGASLT